MGYLRKLIIANIIRDRCQAIKRMIVVTGAAENGKSTAVAKISCIVTENTCFAVHSTKLNYITISS